MTGLGSTPGLSPVEWREGAPQYAAAAHTEDTLGGHNTQHIKTLFVTLCVSNDLIRALYNTLVCSSFTFIKCFGACSQKIYRKGNHSVFEGTSPLANISIIKILTLNRVLVVLWIHFCFKFQLYSFNVHVSENNECDIILNCLIRV